MKRYIKYFLFLIVDSFIWENAMAGWLFQSKQYSDQIKTESYLMNKDQIYSLLKDGEKKQLSYDKLSNDTVHLVVGLKNVGNKGAWGTLLCKIEKDKEVNIYVPHLTPNMKNYANFIVPLEGFVFPVSKNIPKISIEWKNLYSK